MLKIANLQLSSRVILAPMAGITDLPFRVLNRGFGCKFAFVEMINARSLGYKSKKTNSMLSTNQEDCPLGVQLLGCEHNFIQRAMDILAQYKFDLLDFNAACPAKKVTRRGEGASLLKNPKKLNQLLKLVVKDSKVPVTVKIRSGWDKNTLNAKEAALYAQDAGIKALFIHGRSKEQGYSGTVDYKVIKAVKDSLDIPVIASGDILSAPLAKKMFDETGCDGIVVARGALGNPWIFKQIAQYLKNQKIAGSPTLLQIKKVLLKHTKLSVNQYGEKSGMLRMRKWVPWYFKGRSNIRMIKRSVNQIH